MATIAVGISVRSVEMNNIGIAPEEKVALRLSVNSLNAGIVSKISAQFVCKYSDNGVAVEVPVTNLVEIETNVPNNATREYTVSLSAVDEDSGAFAWMRNNNARAAGGHGGGNAPGQVVFRCAWISAKGQGTGDHILSEYDSIYLIDRRCYPVIEDFSLERCNSSGTVDDEGENILTSIKLSIKDNTWLSNMDCHLHYALGNNSVTTGSPYIDLTSDINSLLTGVYNSTTLVTLIVPRTDECHFLLVFGDSSAGWEQSIGRLDITDAFANMHLSGASTGGAAFGMFGTSTEGNPKLESQYPAYFYAGIYGVNNYSTGEVDTGGTWIDGRPIYRRVIASSVTNTNTFVEIGHLISGFGNIGVVINVQGCVVRKTGGKIMPLMFWQSSNNYNSIHFSNDGTGTVLAYTTTAADFYVVVDYTLESDTATNTVNMTSANQVSASSEMI